VDSELIYEAPALTVIGSVAELTLTGGDGCMFDRLEKNLAWTRDDVFFFLRDCPTVGS
jgi:hypothetical protein